MTDCPHELEKKRKPTPIGNGPVPLPVRVEPDHCSELRPWYFVLDAEDQIITRQLYKERAEDIANRINNGTGRVMHFKAAPESVTACGLEVGVHLLPTATTFRHGLVTCERCREVKP